jgi:Ca2+-binding RTX toxin-like protein
MATEFDDFIFFTGTMQQITTTLTNPYSSKSYFIDDEFNVNNSLYDGLGGTGDILFMTNFGDALSVNDGFGVQLVKNIEIFIAGNGGDIINLADADITYGDVQIFGGNGDDILWGNIGNDLIEGGGGNDIIDGGPGNDELIGGVVGFGGDDNDQIFGGEGDDIIRGNDGDDILYGGTDLGLRDLDKDFMDNISFPDLVSGTNIVDLVPPGTSSLGIYADNLHVDYKATAELTFRDGFAGYENTLAIYEVGESGVIQNIQVLWGNVKEAGINNTYTVDIPTGADGGEFGFFIVADGYTRNGNYAGLDVEGEGNISIIYDYGGVNERLGTIFDDGNMLSTVYNDGVTEFALNGYTYHTTARGGDNSINHDGMAHVVSGLANDGDGEVFRIGFEDLPSLGDADFEDVLFDFNINEIRVDASEPGNDLLDGGAGDDILYGEAGDDLLIVGEGLDQIYGGSGSDVIQFTVADGLIDQIKDFETGVGGDVIDLSEVLSFGDTVGDLIEDFVSLVQDGVDTKVYIDADGAANGQSFAALAIIEDGVSDTLADLVSNGNLVA